jgi:hypothetical protein
MKLSVPSGKRTQLPSPKTRPSSPWDYTHTLAEPRSPARPSPLILGRDTTRGPAQSSKSGAGPAAETRSLSLTLVPARTNPGESPPLPRRHCPRPPTHTDTRAAGGRAGGRVAAQRPPLTQHCCLSAGATRRNSAESPYQGRLIRQAEPSAHLSVRNRP